jgi:predicted dinucleotide-binding enzyme
VPPHWLGHGPASLADLVAELGPSIQAATVAHAASANIVLVAVRWVDAEQVLRSMPAWNGRIVIDGTNPVEFFDPATSPDAQDASNPRVRSSSSWFPARGS